jgi:hypothetical protein
MNLRLGSVAVFGALICILVFGVGTAQATVITYIETSYAGGDFPASGYPSLGTLDIGLNSITGIATVLGQPNVDTDTFSVILPSGDEITSGSWIITGATGYRHPSGSGVL